MFSQCLYKNYEGQGFGNMIIVEKLGYKIAEIHELINY